MKPPLKIGTRESELAVWQATLVKTRLLEKGIASELVYIKSDGDVDTVTPLYELGVQGIFTKTLDAALLSKKIDIAVHSMKDVPTVLAKGIQQAAVLQRASYKDILVYKGSPQFLEDVNSEAVIATSSTRRKAQWLNRYKKHIIENLRGNVNTRLRKVDESDWKGAIFAAAGLERIHLRPEHSVDLDWMLPAPSQGAIMVACREDDDYAFECGRPLNHQETALCTKIEKDFLRELMGGCSTPVAALAEIKGSNVVFRGNICSTDGSEKIEIEEHLPIQEASGLGRIAGKKIIKDPIAQNILHTIRNEKS